jgi:hypothetical protein
MPFCCPWTEYPDGGISTHGALSLLSAARSSRHVISRHSCAVPECRYWLRRTLFSIPDGGRVCPRRDATTRVHEPPRLHEDGLFILLHDLHEMTNFRGRFETQRALHGRRGPGNFLWRGPSNFTGIGRYLYCIPCASMRLINYLSRNSSSALPQLCAPLFDSQPKAAEFGPDHALHVPPYVILLYCTVCMFCPVLSCIVPYRTGIAVFPRYKYVWYQSSMQYGLVASGSSGHEQSRFSLTMW